MRFQILGPIAVQDGERAVALGGIKPRAVLAVLLLHANEPVSADRLALALWGEEAPGGAVKTVQVHVSRLRKALGDSNAVVTTAAGYRLRVRDGELDAADFEGLVEDGRQALAGGQAEDASAILRKALGLWRGPALAELSAEPFAVAEIARLEEQRLAALELRVEADLAVNRHAEVVGELGQLVCDHPLRERLAGQLMLALYRCGRQTEALEAYTTTRRALVEGMGIEPGPQLRELHEAILRQDVGLQAQSEDVALPPALDPTSAQPLAGRDEQLDWLRARWERAREGVGGLVALTGARGVGKSRLVAELARDAHGPGVAVLHARGEGPADAVLVALRRAREAVRPTLVVIDDADRGGAGVHDELSSLVLGLASLPVLVIACAEDPLALSIHQPAEALALEVLDPDAVREIAVRYAPDKRAADVPANWLWEACGGVPRRVHELASQWARREAARHVGSVAQRARAGRAELQVIEAELTGGVRDLQETRGRDRPSRGEGTTVVCPFKGLASYDVEDAPYFFGREHLVAELVAKLVGTSLLGVVGPSGSGKSSVLRAGLLPALAGGVLPGSENWAQRLMRPGAHPMRELNTALAGGGDGRVVLAVDQFEEVFTVCEDAGERTEFVEELVAAAQDPGERYVVVIALRADQYGRCAEHPQLASLLAAGNVLVGSMRSDELRRAVQGPAQRAGLSVEAELVDALIADVEREPGGLPLMSTALLELWQRRDGRRLELRSYERVGGVHGAVARLAEQAFSYLGDDQQHVARGVLMRLVGSTDSDAVERRRVALDDLEIDRDEDVARVIALLTDRRLLTVSAGTVELAHEALLREWPRLRGWIDEDLDGLRIQRALRAAAAEWERLSRDDGALYRGTRLLEAVQWRDGRRPPLTASEREFLHAAEQVRARDRATLRRRRRLTAAAVATLASALVAIVVAVLFAERDRDVAASRDLATKSATLVVTDPGLALAVALQARRRSDTEQARIAVRQATLEHRGVREIAAHDDLVEGLAVSPDGRRAVTGSSDRSVKIWDLRSGRLVGQVGGYDAKVRAVGYSADGTRIASAANDGEIATAPVDGGQRTVVARLRGDFARGIAFASGDRSLAIGTDKGRVALIGLNDGDIRDFRPATPAPVFTVAVDSQGGRVLSAGADGFARIWDVEGGPPIELRHSDSGPALAAAFSPDGRRVATTGLDGRVVLWSARSGRRQATLTIDDEPLASVSFAATGRSIVTAGVDGVVRVISVDGGVVSVLKGHNGPVRADIVGAGSMILSAGEEDGTLRTWAPLATRLPARPGTTPVFGAAGRLVVSGDASGPVHLWDTKTGEERQFDGHGGESFPQLSPDASQIVSASFDGTVRLWDVRTGKGRVVPTLDGEKYAAAIDPAGERIAIGGATQLVIQAPDGSRRELLSEQPKGVNVNALVFSPDGTHLLTGSDDGLARVWNADDGALERTLRGHEGIVRGVAYSDDGRRIATAGSDGTIRVWRADGDDDPVILVGHEGAVNTARFDGDGDRIVSAGDDGAIRIWDAAGGAALVVLHRHGRAAKGADFSADGSAVVSAARGDMRITPCEVCGTFQDVLRVAKTRAQHALTKAEQARLLQGG